jgi:inner membrane protein involved in colicin E2 resistance
VVSIWGAPHKQKSPTASYIEVVHNQVDSIEDNRKITRFAEERVARPLPLESSRVDVALDLEHRQKGLLWYSTYRVDFRGAYTFRSTSSKTQQVELTLTLPAAKAIYDDLKLVADGRPVELENRESSIRGTARVEPGKTTTWEVSYRSQGLDTWEYNFGSEVAQVRDFQLNMRTNFDDIDFPDNTLSPTGKQAVSGGWELTWAYRNLLSGFQIGMVMPQKLQPGPLAGQISFFAPVSLLFYFFVLFIITTLRKIDLHPMNYFFLACAFFSFHLLLAYLVDHVSIHTAFVVCSIVSLFLVVSYMRLAVGLRFAAVEAALAQVIYLIFFSYAFFFEGYTGLTITIGAILTLFVAMQMTGRVRWSEKFARSPAAAGSMAGQPGSL